ncbi:hypothetical protein LCGC14_1737670 [marine sediment metagenome]|uniref:Uncharacterized protein n=1 Tax=marine sediment metagenome TaxID=412755 RepID=A0A0F9K7B6_9ZZZZ
MRQKYATKKDVYRIMNHYKSLVTLRNLGLHETKLFTCRRGIVPEGLVPRIFDNHV